MASTEDNAQCRICLDTENEQSNPLFRPCSCRGTAAWVHVDCLTQWRRTSVNPRSFYECDQCHYKYQFKSLVVDKFTISQLLGSPVSVFFVALAFLYIIILLSGSLIKLFTARTWGEVFAIANLEHHILGSAFTGILSLAGFAGTWHGVRSPFFLGRNNGGGKMSEIELICFAIMVFIGLCMALFWIFQRLESYAKQATRYAQQAVLDAQTGTTPNAAEAGWA
eukprot:c20684_g2_i1.p1 GENE.c20684_g2_i1~~c20684_g2_i1.p1  ORF type:complete len:231 (+),score=33.10 c20684_g2_i1:25-693(+)